ncbi:MAG: CotH kinase family protein [Spirochaetales bacterium]|nr:CotH kinase family protein [Spirochaetales bacterium]
MKYLLYAFCLTLLLAACIHNPALSAGEVPAGSAAEAGIPIDPVEYRDLAASGTSCMAATDLSDTDALYDELFCDEVQHRFIIRISRSEWDGISQDMLDYAREHPVTPFYDGDGRPYRNNDYRKADFSYLRPDGSEIVLEEVGIRTRGNESRRLPMLDGNYRKTHFKIKFDETFDLENTSPEGTERDKRRFAGMKSLDFKWSRYFSWDKYANMTKINELFSYELLERSGVTVPKMSMATLAFVIDGKTVEYGLYGIVEHVDKAFLKKRFGADNDGDLYKCLYLDGGGAHLTVESLGGNNVGVRDVDRNYRPLYDLKTNEKTSDHAALREFVTNLNELEGEEFVTWLDANFEVDKFLRFLAMGIYINNLDDYRFLANNYYLYFRQNGKIEFIPYDFDISLGTAWHGEMDYARFINQDIFNTANIPRSWGDASARPLVVKVLAVAKYRQKYVHYFVGCLVPDNGLFLFSRYRDKYNLIAGLYRDSIKNDTVDPDPMGWKGYEEKYFHDKTGNVLDQLNIGHDGFEVQ